MGHKSFRKITISAIIILSAFFTLAACGKNNFYTEGTTEKTQETTKESTQEPVTSSTTEAVYSENLKWNGSEHQRAEDDDNVLEGDELLASALSGKHSFTYRAFDDSFYEGEIYAQNDSMLNMEELNYLISLNSRIKISSFTVVDLDGNGTNEVIIDLSLMIGNEYMIFYMDNEEVYMTSIKGRCFGDFMENGNFIAPTGDLATLNFNSENVKIIYHTGYEPVSGGTYKYYVKDQEVSYEEYTQFIEAAKKESTLCQWSDFTQENIKKAFCR